MQKVQNEGQNNCYVFEYINMKLTEWTLLEGVNIINWIAEDQPSSQTRISGLFIIVGLPLTLNTSHLQRNPVGVLCPLVISVFGLLCLCTWITKRVLSMDISRCFSPFNCAAFLRVLTTDWCRQTAISDWVCFNWPPLFRTVNRLNRLAKILVLCSLFRKISWVCLRQRRPERERERGVLQSVLVAVSSTRPPVCLGFRRRHSPFCVTQTNIFIWISDQQQSSVTPAALMTSLRHRSHIELLLFEIYFSQDTILYSSKLQQKLSTSFSNSFFIAKKNVSQK